jgi:hypothetical protein
MRAYKVKYVDRIEFQVEMLIVRRDGQVMNIHLKVEFAVVLVGHGIGPNLVKTAQNICWRHLVAGWRGFQMLKGTLPL